MQHCCARSAAELGNVYLSNWVSAPDLRASNTRQHQAEHESYFFNRRPDVNQTRGFTLCQTIALQQRDISHQMLCPELSPENTKMFWLTIREAAI